MTSINAVSLNALANKAGMSEHEFLGCAVDVPHKGTWSSYEPRLSEKSQVVPQVVKHRCPDTGCVITVTRIKPDLREKRVAYVTGCCLPVALRKLAGVKRLKKTGVEAGLELYRCKASQVR